MDSSSFDQADLDRLSTQDKQELRQFINNEQQKANIHQRTPPQRATHTLSFFLYFSPLLALTRCTGSHDLTETCWKKCVTGSMKSNALDKGEQACLANCVDRFMDANVLAVKHLQNMRQG